MKWASPWVEQQLRLALLHAQEATVMRTACNRGVGMESVRGFAFELVMHKLLSQGGAFKVRTLCPSGTRKDHVAAAAPSDGEETLCVRQVKQFSSVSDLVPVVEQAYYRPRSNFFPSTDAFDIVRTDTADKNSRWVVIRSFQATVSRSHGLTPSGLHEILDAVRRSGWKVSEIHHYVVVPLDRLADYVNGRLTAKNSAVEGVVIVEKAICLRLES